MPIYYRPSVIFTDEDPAYLAAQKEILPDTTGFRCDWHLLKDVTIKLNSLDIKGESAKDILNLFDDLRQSANLKIFNDKFANFMTYLSSCKDVEKRTKLVSYFNTQYLSKERWAHYARSAILTFGANTTQRFDKLYYDMIYCIIISFIV
jgi:hypothetical protein